MILRILQIFGALGIFLYGMKMMSDGIQKSAGSRVKTALDYMTINRCTAVLTGFLVTGVIQSSSATTVMVVSLVNAGLFNLTQAIGVILGANIGTTVTGWIVAVVGFKFDIAAFALPAIALAAPLVFVPRFGHENAGEALMGFGLLFLGLSLLKNSVPDIKSSPEVLEFLGAFTNRGFGSFLIFVAAGTLVTIIVQSSSAAMAITLTMAYSGWIDYPSAACLVLGENIGTTITAYLASLGANINARRAARAHTLFNVMGVVWMALFFSPFLKAIAAIIPETPGDMGYIATRLALFHTLFNVTNTVLFLPFIKPFSRLVSFLVKARTGENEERYRLFYSPAGLGQSAEINIIKAQAEIKKMVELLENIFRGATDAVLAPHKDARRLAQRVDEEESLLALMHEEISQFLVHCSREHISTKSLERLNLLIRVCNESASIGDSCRKMTSCALVKAEKKIEFDKQGGEEIRHYAGLVKNFLDFNLKHLGTRLSDSQLLEAEALENSIDGTRDILRKASQKRLKTGSSSVKTEILYIDILRHIEHVGDHSFEISRCLHRMTARHSSPVFGRTGADI
ncbi:MAG: Na/Pi cotransporter family protein [Spirochaetales bacterium]|jgi:phosphate:Na+ symporter|nr:Na/Pi cotransporter family protein [Spirochaetales bacterium]